MLRKYILTLSFISVIGFTDLSYAACTASELTSKAQTIMFSMEGNVPVDQLDALEEKLEKASDFYEAGQLDQACQIYDEVIKKYNFPPLNQR